MHVEGNGMRASLVNFRDIRVCIGVCVRIYVRMYVRVYVSDD